MPIPPTVPTVSTEPAAEPTVGVGPWQGAWPVDDRYDPQLLADGDARNVVDRYRYWRLEAIVADLDTPRFPDDALAPVLDLLTGLAVRRHGATSVVRALARPQRAPDTIAAF